MTTSAGGHHNIQPLLIEREDTGSRTTSESNLRPYDQESQNQHVAISSSVEDVDATTESLTSLVEVKPQAFSRDQPGRQSMSEKRHATLDAKNTDTYQKRKKARDDREKQGNKDVLRASQLISKSAPNVPGIDRPIIKKGDEVVQSAKRRNQKRVAKNLKFQAKQQRKADARIKDASKIEPPSDILKDLQDFSNEEFVSWREEFIWETEKIPSKKKDGRGMHPHGEIKPMSGTNTITINPEDQSAKYKRGY